jgi:hypothetical protein
VTIRSGYPSMSSHEEAMVIAGDGVSTGGSQCSYCDDIYVPVKDDIPFVNSPI